MTRLIKPPFPYPIAFYWRFGNEMSKQQIDNYGCTDPEKQKEYRNLYGVCKHLQLYGKEKNRKAAN